MELQVRKDAKHQNSLTRCDMNELCDQSGEILGAVSTQRPIDSPVGVGKYLSAFDLRIKPHPSVKPGSLPTTTIIPTLQLSSTPSLPHFDSISRFTARYLWAKENLMMQRWGEFDRAIFLVVLVNLSMT